MKPPPPERRRTDNGDFASAAMVRVLTQGLRDLGLPLPTDRAPRPSPAAVVRLEDKRALLQHAVRVGGFECLARLGQGLHRFPHEPTHLALASARNARDLLERWGRLERYIHSRHRVEVLAVDERQARLRHIALQPSSPPPQPAEDLVVLGVLAAFLQACGHEGVQAWAGDARVCPDCEPQPLAQAIASHHSHEWVLSWDTHAPSPQPAQRPSELRRIDH